MTDELRAIVAEVEAAIDFDPVQPEAMLVYPLLRERRRTWSHLPVGSQPS